VEKLSLRYGCSRLLKADILCTTICYCYALSSVSLSSACNVTYCG